MKPIKTYLLAQGLLVAALGLGIAQAADTVPTDIQQPGTQPGEIGNLESPDKCDNCHGGYNSSVEPAYNWRGSMMAHAGRDPIFWATLAIGEQDFIPGQGGAGDLCIRCHSTGGWLAGRSTPTDGSGLAAGDSDGVECDFCHKLTNPDDSEYLGVMIDPFIANEPPPDPNNDDLFDWAVDWDPNDPTVPDQNPANGIEGYYGSGMASLWGGSDKLGPFNDAQARHQFAQSKFHRDRDFCGTCHDVSNPAVGNLAPNHGAQSTADPVAANGVLGGPVDGKAAFNNPPYKYGIVERTFSEYKAGLISQTLVQDYGTLPSDLQAGALEAVYNAVTQNGTIDPNYTSPSMPRYFSCQTCHMRPVTGTGCNKKGAPERTDLPLHDMTGGNYWMPSAIEYLNNAGKLRLGGGMTATQITAMHDGALRAKEQLSLAATLSLINSGGNPTVRIVNHTGHKLISGYPEGRRMWLNVKWYDDQGNPVGEDGEYGTLQTEMDIDGDGVPGELGEDVVETILNLDDPNLTIYEAHMGMTREWASTVQTLHGPDFPLSYDRVSGDVMCTVSEFLLDDNAPEKKPECSGDYHETFHFVLNNTVVKDNRIPPYGMSYEVARMRNALPVPATQYGGGPIYNYYDEVGLNPPLGATSATIDLVYQPTSWEYIQFLYLANKGTDPALGGNAFLGEEGVNMLEAWLNTGMAAPYVMASTTWGTPPGACDAPTPSLLSATPGDKQVTVTWQEIPADPIQVDGYRLYYDQAGKAQLIVDQPWLAGQSSYTDTSLTNGQEYCYKVTSYTTTCESGFSNILCATPTQPGQAVTVGVSTLETGKWVKEGKGKNATTNFVLTSSFAQGDGVVVQATVVDEGGTPVPDATVNLHISGPETVDLQTGPSDADGIAEATWQTQAPNKHGTGGTTPGSYTATTTDVTASGYVWDGVPTSVGFTIGQ
jgi:hypothetical protein